MSSRETERERRISRRVDHLAMLSRFFSSVHLTLEGRTQMYIHACSCCRPCLFLFLALYHSFVQTHTRSDNKNRSFYGGCSNYICVCVWVRARARSYVYISLLPFFSSSSSLHDRLNLWLASETKRARADRTGSSSLNRTDTHPSFLSSTFSTSVRSASELVHGRLRLYVF